MQRDLTVEASSERIRRIAIDVHPRSFGFVILEDAVVLDAGVRSCDQDQSQACLLARLRAILVRYDPAILILRGAPRKRLDKSAKVLLSTSIQTVAKELGILVSISSESNLRRYFSRHQAFTKYEIATVIARLLPALAWHLPPKRRAWQAEPYWYSVFEAAALALPQVAFLHSAQLDSGR